MTRQTTPFPALGQSPTAPRAWIEYPLPLRWFVTTLTVLATATVLSALTLTVLHPPHAMAFAAAVVAYLCAARGIVPSARSVSGQDRSHQAVHIGTVLSLCLLGPAATVVAYLPALALFPLQPVNCTGRDAFRKTYNLSVSVLSVAAGCATWAVLHITTHNVLASTVGLIGAVIASETLSSASWGIVSALIEHRRPTLSDMTVVPGPMLGVVLSSGLASLARPTLAQHHYIVVLIAAPLAWCVQRATLIYLRMRGSAEVWQRIEQASGNLAKPGLEENDISNIGAHAAQRLFGVQRAEVIRDHDDGTAITHVMDNDTGKETRYLPRNETSREDPLLVYPIVDTDGHHLGRLVLHRDLGIIATVPYSFGPVIARALGAAMSNARLLRTVQAQHNTAVAETRISPSTRLQNRLGLTETTDLANLADIPYALLVLDLDGFKRVNDTYGHAAGDRVLRDVADRLRKLLDPGQSAYHIGGDEFAVLAVNIEDVLDATELASRIRTAIHEPFEVDNLARLPLGCSVGVAIANLPDHPSVSPNDLMCHAELAMYRAKHLGRDRSEVYSSAMDTSVNGNTLSILGDVEEAMSTGAIRLYYQPQINLSTQVISGFEALVRWERASGKILGPDQFVPVVEQSPLMHKFTRHVIKQAALVLADLNRDGHDYTMSVNVSPRNLMDMNLVADVDDALRSSGAPANKLIIEITESETVHESSFDGPVLAGLRALGVQISMDDFGTGSSNLSLVGKFHVNEIKIDKQFVMGEETASGGRTGGMLRDEGHAAVVRSMIDIAHSKGCKVVAEGVESEAILNKLQAIGVDIVQGYYIQAPVSLLRLRAWLIEWEIQPHPIAPSLNTPVGEPVVVDLHAPRNRRSTDRQAV